ncbi:DegT/DnrJ/EryC1/StrS family aminotransferase [Oleidesulfovibrio sp.]|uniref:DegT/DnrJ/EryC1/StrS family aminotransferase n=1 Tax=Oleidesulfovibrio sp. TaxID=2909707 RepID=UPI003A84717C
MTEQYSRIFLSPPHMGGQELDLITQAFKSNYVAPLGPMVNAFEKDFAEFSAIPHCAALSSGTAALHLALRILDVGAGDVVMASSLTFIGSVSPATFMGAEPVFIDCDTHTWNMDPDLLATAIADYAAKGRTPKAVIATDLYGQCADYDKLQALCDTYDVPLIIDAAEAAGARYKDRHAGDAGFCSVFSFNGNKIITTSGGGMLCSNNAAVVEKARWLAQQARDAAPHYEHSQIGYNYRMSNICAAIGCGQLQVLAQRVEQKRSIFEHYKRVLSRLEGVSFMPEAEYGRCTRWLTVMLLDPAVCRCTPEELRLALEEHNIESRPVWKPMHMQPVFADCTVYGGKVSEELFHTGLCLPSGTALTGQDLTRITTLIEDALDG